MTLWHTTYIYEYTQTLTNILELIMTHCISFWLNTDTDSWTKLIMTHCMDLWPQMNTDRSTWNPWLFRIHGTPDFLWQLSFHLVLNAILNKSVVLYFFLLNKINNKKLSGITRTISQMQINKTELFSSWFHILLRFHKDLEPRKRNDNWYLKHITMLRHDVQ
jgi:hypothetical protein